ncbi:glycosyltransferase family 9 protein [Ichthyenterobacterium sp. W332]|uniref:Glycosyltransferase family 9 protein n=1 Tax=Microcosmobacter mediterraneus TaxID=3075607 RepID=A0ABU2YMY0_9FLAO|nr:glycosyltransferase family 9 protein [Ichthyenterobacterium sp. W332]MDT0559509.1 glycosyltransferase family 9 protein [Ichthyenterobacterium sp. W332]
MKKILVIQNKRIGDVLLASLIAENIKLVYPESTIEFMVYDYTAGVIENHPLIDKIILIKEKELKKIPNLIKTALQIRKAKYDIILDPYAKFQSRIMCLLSGAPQRIGYKKKDKNPPLKFYTHNVSFLKEKSHPCGKSLEDRVHLVTSVYPIDQPVYVPKIYLTETEQQYSKLQSYDKPVIMFGILGSTPQKSMPYKYITELIDFVTVTFDVYALFNYSPHQKDDAKSIYEACKHKDRIIFDIYEDNIRGFITLMNKCKLLIANEGGTVHIAKALDKPTFTIFSPYVLKEHWASFEDGKMHTSVHLLDEKPDLFSTDRDARKKIEEDPSFLYNQLSPELIIPKLNNFLKQHF